MKLLAHYKNGNVDTMLFEDGTLIRSIPDGDIFRPAFASNMDIKITDYCDIGCPYCHEGSSIHGKHADIMNEKFVDTLHEGQEVALGGGNVLSHPDFIPFLEKLKDLNVIANITVNQEHFTKHYDTIKWLSDNKYVYGIGVSLKNPTLEFTTKVRDIQNTVIHVINGVFSEDDYSVLKNRGLKLLILGYKDIRRGEQYYKQDDTTITKNQEWLEYEWSNMLNEFEVISFDNLALEQLNIKSHISQEQWDQFYMGDDGTFTYYIDMVNRQFAVSSTAPLNERMPLLDSVDDMFHIIQEKAYDNR